MLQPRIRGSRAGFDISSTATPLSTLAAAFNSLALCPRHSSLLPRTTIRNASHAAQGRANGPKDSAGRRLGAKKTSTQYVIPGNIIFKQRGTKWFPGENVGMGKDHTIYATVAGYVRYYRNPSQHPKRRYIGVALEKEGPGSVLPTPHNAPTRRRLGMYATPMVKANESDAEFLENHLSENSKAADSMAGQGKQGEVMVKTIAPAATGVGSAADVKQAWKVVMKPGTVWESNYELGRAAEKKGITAREFDRKDRWLAWRKRGKKIREKLLARAAKATRKTSGKKSNKGAVMGVRK